MATNNIINILPENVANQIAAGEVIQRPASVIKELVENAVDANATAITINLREAGSELIQVIDNGKGMSFDDAAMAFEKHATSKIQEASDLFALHTFGFRGEALASVAAVGEVELHTRRESDETGCHVSIAGGEVKCQEPCTCPTGSNFEVRNLFYNIPARRKFLKSQTTELTNILQEIQRVAMVNPDIAFHVQHNGKSILDLTAGSFLHRIKQLFGSDLGGKLIPVALENEQMSVTGYIARPENSCKKNRQQMLFVNGRYVKSPYFHKALMECYQNLIPEGTQPHYFIYLQVEPSSIDVNISPSKTEVKFENESIRYHILASAVRASLNDKPELNYSSDSVHAILDSEPLPDESKKPAPRPTDPFRQMSSLSLDQFCQDFQNESPLNLGNTYHEQMTTSQEDKLSTATFQQPVPENQLFELTQQESPSPTGHLQVKNRYIVCSLPEGLLLVDQHRAHVRVLYDKYYTQICNRMGISQRLAFPQTIEIMSTDLPHFEQVLPTLSYLGFEIDSLGGGTFAVNGYPAAMESESDFQILMNQIVETVRDGVHGVSEELDQRLALRMAMAQAIPYGRKLEREEMSSLIDSLLSLPESRYTPDGNCVMKVLDGEILSKLL